MQIPENSVYILQGLLHPWYRKMISELRLQLFPLPGRPFSVPPGIVPEPERTDGLLRQQHLENCGKRKSGVQLVFNWRLPFLENHLAS
jgi:hypothetical protein